MFKGKTTSAGMVLINFTLCYIKTLNLTICSPSTSDERHICHLSKDLVQNN